MQIMDTSIFQVNGSSSRIRWDRSVQYTDGSDYNIVTLNSFTREKAKVPADIEFNAEFLAKKLAVMWQDNQDVGKMTGARTKVAGLDATSFKLS